MSAKGTRRTCALPNYEYFNRRYDVQRGYRRRYLYDEYVEECERQHEVPYSFSTFSRELVAWRRGSAQAGIEEWYPGEYLRTFWSFVMDGGKKVPLFVAQLASSDFTYCEAFEKRSAREWMLGCAEAFRFFGGVPYVTDVSMAGMSEAWRTTLEAFCRHYRTVLFGARPKTVATASRADKPLDARNSSAVVRQLRDLLGEGASYGGIDELNRAVSAKLGFLNNVAVPGVPSRRELFERTERAQLLQLPEADYDMAAWGTRRVGEDHHFVVRGTHYSAPWQLAGEVVKTSATENEIVAYAGGVEVARHKALAEPRGRNTVTDPAHRPPTHRWFARRMEVRFMSYAEPLGESVAKAMKVQLARCKAAGKGYRECKELYDLHAEPSEVTLDEACERVFRSGAGFSLDAVRGIMCGDGGKR